MHKRPLLLWLWLALPASAAGQVVDAPRDSAAAAAISEARARWVSAFNARDPLALLQAYTGDAVLINPSGRILGAADLPAFWRNAVRVFSEISVEVEQLEIRGDLAYEVSRYRDVFQPPGPDRYPHGGTQLVVWRRTEHGWRQAAVMVHSEFSKMVVPPDPR